MIYNNNNTMTTHKCNRDTCPPANINGPKMKCIKCKNQCYLKCFGLNIDSTMNSIKIRLPNGIMWVELATSQFSCCDVNPPPTELSSNQQKPKQTITQTATVSELDKNHTMMNEMCEIKNLLNSIKVASDKNSNDLSEIKSSSTETVVLLKKATDRQIGSYRLAVNDHTMGTSGSTTPMDPNNTPRTSKRRFDETKTPKQTPKINVNQLPKPIAGTRNVALGPTPAQRPNKSIEMPTFEKAIWVSGLDPSVSIETMSDYITTNTKLVNKDDFKCHILVKKGADISKMRYISFKIDVKALDFDELIDSSNWPKHVSVREFVKMEPVKLGAFINTSLAEHTDKLRRVENQKNVQANAEQMDLN